jgi:hypothetical protein
VGTSKQSDLELSRNYSFGYWLKGYRKTPKDKSPDILCLETGYYGMMLDMDQLDKAKFGLLNDGLDYEQAVSKASKRMDLLKPSQLEITLEVNNRVYRAVTCKAGIKNDRSHTRLWESGQVAQHYDILGLVFKDHAGEQLIYSGKIDLVAWPDTLTMTVDLNTNVPKDNKEGVAIPPSEWQDASLSIRLKTDENEWQNKKVFPEKWKPGQSMKLTLNCNINGAQPKSDKVKVKLSTPSGQKFPVTFDPYFNSYTSIVKGLKRSFKGGYVKITDYDEFDLDITNSSEEDQRVPFLLDLRGTANITGHVPILCEMDGTPTGIPVQLSKNWHYPEMGEYLRAYAVIPVKPGGHKYRLRIAYGFYGSLPSASHAQLSLVGYYGKSGRWDQLALACGGESITFDADMSATDLSICDVRAPLAQGGKEGNPWSWTDAGWGGDWLRVLNRDNHKLPHGELKTAYLSHGPCLSDVIYKGAYGSDQDVLLEARIQNPRTDDYGRTYQQLKYHFMKQLSTTNSSLMTKVYYLDKNISPDLRKIAIGNSKGLIKEVHVPIKQGVVMPATELTGPGPWWITAPGNVHVGYIGMVIRDYHSTFNGKDYSNPYVSANIWQINKNQIKMDVKIVPPPHSKSYHPGDSVEMDVHWLHLTSVADNYGGPNEDYRKHLAQNPLSWKTTYREAIGNDLELKVIGGKVLKNYPIIIQAHSPEISISISGGIACVPIRIEGLKTKYNSIYQVIDGKEKELDQSNYGNDFWQTEYTPASNTYKMTFNLPLDGMDRSQWILKPVPKQVFENRVNADPVEEAPNN